MAVKGARGILPPCETPHSPKGRSIQINQEIQEAKSRCPVELMKTNPLSLVMQ
jgi:hypothetical protein